MPIEYVMSVISGDPKDAEPTRVLTTKIIELKKLQENRLKAQNNVGTNQWRKIHVESTKNY
jgi:hypothetical protein